MKKIIGPLIILLAIALPFIIAKYYLHLLILTGIYCIAVFGLNVVMGYTGLASLVQASFFGIAAYTSALLTLRLGLSFWIAMPLATLSVVILSVFLGVVTLRLVSHYFVICTFGLSQIVYIILNNWMSLTNGPGGIQDIGSPDPIPVFPFNLIDFSTKLHYYYFVLFFLILTISFVSWLMRTSTGNAFLAIREDSDLAQAEGIWIMKYKVYSFAISAFLAGIAGALYAHYLKFLTPEMFTISESLTMVVVLLIGGSGTLVGPVLGSIINTVIPELFNLIPEERMILYGFFVVFFIIFIPGGLVGLSNRVFRKGLAPK